MGLQPKTTEVTILDENLWQLSDHGQGNCPTGTMDLTKFEVNAAGGIIPDSFAVVLNTATKLYEPAIAWDPAAASGAGAYVQAAKASGHVFQPVSYDAGQTRAQFALFWHGRVAKAKVSLPTAHVGAAFDATKGAPGIVYV